MKKILFGLGIFLVLLVGAVIALPFLIPPSTYRQVVETQLETALGRHGVKPIDAAPGAVFDPNLHQAVAQIPSDQPSGTIASVFQLGWKIGERTLRAAMVAVSAGGAN